MTRNQLFTRLNKLCNEMQCDYNINNGGCCFVAACIAENLEKVNIPYRVIKFDLYSLHYAIKVKDRYINREDYKSEEQVGTCCQDSEDLFTRYYEGYWNPEYNRQWNLIVSTKINSLFKKYENSRT